MAASPVTQVGCGFEDALETSNEMAKICFGHNPTFSIPTWTPGLVWGSTSVKSLKQASPQSLILSSPKEAGVGQSA